LIGRGKPAGHRFKSAGLESCRPQMGPVPFETTDETQIQGRIVAPLVPGFSQNRPAGPGTVPSKVPPDGDGYRKWPELTRWTSPPKRLRGERSETFGAALTTTPDSSWLELHRVKNVR
jgi:hypothetical protein